MGIDQIAIALGLILLFIVIMLALVSIFMKMWKGQLKAIYLKVSLPILLIVHIKLHLK
jgi:hypothetical protein